VAYTSEIEKLEARYRENPKGRNFAPLADAYRKAGLIDNAIELCQAGLQLHPDYVSGHIVHGRCLVDKKDDTGAESVFRKVLELDPENILALKVLAEISERNDRFDQAVEWLNRLLLADPMNGEAAEGLSRVRGKAAAQPPVPPPVQEPVATMLMEPAPETPLQVEHEELELETSAVPPGAGAPPSQPRLSIEYMEGPFDAGMADATTAAMDRPEFDLERTSEPAMDSSVVAPPGEIETYDSLDLNQVAPGEVIADGIELEEPGSPAPVAEIQIEGLARTQYEGSGVFKLDKQPPSSVEPLDEHPASPVTDLPLIMPDDLDSAPWVAARPSRETEPIELSAAEAAPAAPPPMRLPDDDGAADTAALSRAEPVVTETMAELYLRQGHREDALHVYQALLAQRPQDPRLRQKVMELSAPPPRRRSSGSGQSAGAFLKGIMSAKPGAPAPVLPRDPAAASPAAPSRPSGPASLGNVPAESDREAEPDTPAPGSPTRPASDAISLDSVFGEEGGRGSVPALPEPVPEQPSKLPAASGGFSFDDFFGTATAPGSGTGKPAANARPPRPSGGGRNRSPEQEEDLDQFQAWLKSLKA
jgi:tetratricopeptide (TPR) repeat protein